MANKKVAILGGSFNPPHIGHVEICTYIIDNNLADEVWVIPCFKHPFGKISISFEDRLAMCELAFDIPKVKVLDIERGLGGYSYTIETIETLVKKNPSFKFQLIVGSDILEEKKKWKNIDRIEALVAFTEIPRGARSPITDISSTEIRKMFKDEKNPLKFLDSKIFDYIKANALY